jgi:hypothetical protein
MPELDLDDVLHRVATGELSPDEALTLLEPAGAEPGAHGGAAPSPAATTQEPPRAAESPAWGTPTTARDDRSRTGRSRLVRVNASYRSVDVLGDPSVAEVAVSGSHAVRSDDGVLVVESHENPLASVFGTAAPGTRFSFADLPRGLTWARAWKDQHLVIRVNPELPVEIDAAGANLRVSGMEAGTKVRLIASALKLDRSRGPLDLDAFTSSVKGSATPSGSSRISAESSSVKLHLGAGTDTRITARNRMGKVVLPNAVSRAGLVDPEVTQATVGSGRGELAVDAVMSSVILTSTDDEQLGAQE